jgi:hypothetical protein
MTRKYRKTGRFRAFVCRLVSLISEKNQSGARRGGRAVPKTPINKKLRFRDDVAA